jgi:RNA polymerase sigma-70 factor, ECF subfamily
MLSRPSHPATDCKAEVYRVGRLEFANITWTLVEFDVAWRQHGRELEGAAETYRDEYLRVACLARAAGAVEALEVQYILPLRAVLEKRCGDPDLADEAVQQLRQKLLVGPDPRLATYQSTGHLRAWLQVVAIRLCQDLARQRGVRWARESPLANEHSSSHGIDVRMEKRELDELFVAALREVIGQLPARERHALRMHVLAGWNVSQIGESLDIHRSSAARWIAAAKERINENVRNLLRERLDLSSGELERLFDLFSTQLEVRLSQVFNTAPALGESPTDEDP